MDIVEIWFWDGSRDFIQVEGGEADALVQEAEADPNVVAALVLRGQEAQKRLAE